MATEMERAEVLAALGFISAVTVFEETTPFRIIQALAPDILVKGADWPLERIVGREEVEAAGGKVIRVPLTKGMSTTALIEKIQKMES